VCAACIGGRGVDYDGWFAEYARYPASTPRLKICNLRGRSMNLNSSSDDAKFFPKKDHSRKQIFALTVDCQWQSVIENGLRHLGEFPDDPDVLPFVAFALFNNKNLYAALEVARYCRCNLPNSYMTSYVLALTLMECGERKEALLAFRETQKYLPIEVNTLKAILKLETEFGNGSAAVEEFVAKMREAGHQVKPKMIRIETSEEYSNRCLQDVMFAGERENIYIKRPKLAGCDRDETVLAVIESAAPRLLRLNNGIVYSRSDLIQTSESTGIHDFAASNPHGGWVNLSTEGSIISRAGSYVYLVESELRTIYLEKVFSLLGAGTHAFGHWLPDYLPRLQPLLEFPSLRDIPIAIDEGMPPAHVEHLRRLVDNPMFVVPPNSKVCVKELFYSPPTTFFPLLVYPEHKIPMEELSVLSPRGMRFVARNIERYKCTGEGRRLYLSRSSSSWRKPINESEIKDEVTKHGFECIELERLNMGSQIELFMSASVIIAPQGAALYNCAFCQTGTHILILAQSELFNSAAVNGPLADLGFDITFLLASDDNARQHEDFTVPIQSLRAAIRQIMYADN
jgi:hypothetical protein